MHKKTCAPDSRLPILKFVSNPPEAAALMTSARSFGNYDLAGAIADLIDNSINAKATRVWIRCLYEDGAPIVSVADDGLGMTPEQLIEAMRPASTDPRKERSPDDLGRFGWGMKSASFSQCTKLTVLTVQDGVRAGASWDLNDIDKWRMGVLTAKEVAAATLKLPNDHGTEVVWTNCDRLSDKGTLSQTAFNDLIDHTRRELALTFHKYLSGLDGARKLAIEVNGLAIEPWDPFYRSHLATQQLEPEVLPVEGAPVLIQPFILPHFSKLKLAEHERLGGEEGFLRNQGFYVYRNHRLIIHGTWFRLAKFGELSQLVRIAVDIPNSLDDLWKITVDKSDAQLPAVLRRRLSQVVDHLRRHSSRVYRAKGGRLDRPGTTSVWSRYSRNNEIRYAINREHPAIAGLLADPVERDEVENALKLIEQGFPVATFSQDAAQRADQIHQTASEPQELVRMVELTMVSILHDLDGDMKAAVERLKLTEPFASNWPLAEEHLIKKGWIRD